MKRGNWTVSETTNKIFIPNLKNYKVDTHQVVSQCYKDANQLWIAARAATKAFEDLSYVQEDGGDNKIRMDIIEKIQKLAIYIFATAKSMEKEARNQSTTALRIPSNMRYLEEESSKKLVFSTYKNGTQEEQGHHEVLLDGSLPGGRLQNFVENWKSMIHHPWLKAIGSKGPPVQYHENQGQ
ncbi:hypothetical protein G6F57_003041 [Rhizopus arrhizus]|uniref:Uncharacterized protein n=1 Tax=Rhizopus oryzae TaxID=64495 RepID=A0A9P6XF70_RHIOR|nr:hypothetical protein G6F23_010814 [Rhizopus arrhizus]KAG1398395.1 hypothetical protein G6F58_011334 [Rhizopus delemar]KAG0767482.1 hypothetical protein G6F24_002742 [Rhizopus arrhizus]KAG0780187.1 hypothetical protein G6F22_010222 [Rhizopus arrhizus]KAG0780600.1 hypothetical protein G6F21_012061 [Rhizopus arrhizus]